MIFVVNDLSKSPVKINTLIEHMMDHLYEVEEKGEWEVKKMNVQYFTDHLLPQYNTKNAKIDDLDFNTFLGLNRLEKDYLPLKLRYPDRGFDVTNILEDYDENSRWIIYDLDLSKDFHSKFYQMLVDKSKQVHGTQLTRVTFISPTAVVEQLELQAHDVAADYIKIQHQYLNR